MTAQLTASTAEANSTLGEIYLRQGRLDEAQAALRAELSQRPANHRARYLLAVVLDLADQPDEAVEALGLDARTALVLLTHDPKLDDPALMAALRADVFYIGALGSTRTHAKRVSRLQDAGYSDDQIARIHGPIGLDIGAAGPSEIGVAILAQMTAVLRGRST